MKVEFICNVPALEDYSCYQDLMTSCKPRIFVDIEPLVRHGNVVVGPAYGNPLEGDVGLYLYESNDQIRCVAEVIRSIPNSDAVEFADVEAAARRIVDMLAPLRTD